MLASSLYFNWWCTLLIFPCATSESALNNVCGLCHKQFGHQWFTEARVMRYQSFVSVHNTWLHSECYTVHKGSNKPYENNTILPTNIQTLKLSMFTELTMIKTQYEQEVIHCNLMNYVQFITPLAGSPSYGFLIYSFCVYFNLSPSRRESIVCGPRKLYSANCWLYLSQISLHSCLW
jgi:hypothetical protein